MRKVPDRMVTPSLKAKAALFVAGFMLATAAPQVVLAQNGQPTQAAPLLTESDLAKLVWTTMVAVDQANVTGNYSVLRDMAAPGFQAANDPAKLGQIFASLRASGANLSDTLLLAPTYRAQPRMVQADMVQVQGSFASRPTAINFELLYQWTGGKWRLFGVAIAPQAMASQSAPPAAAVPPVKKK